MLQICKFYHVAFRANVLYPYQRRNLNTVIFEYRANSFMKFIPTDNNMNDIPYGKNGYYCSTMTQAGEYIQLFIQSVEVFRNTPTFRPFYILCLYYDFMSYVQGFIETSLANATFVGVSTVGGAPPVVGVGDDGENIVGLIFVGLLIEVEFPNINGTGWFPSWMVLSNIDCCCCCMWSFKTAMSLTSAGI